MIDIHTQTARFAVATAVDQSSLSSKSPPAGFTRQQKFAGLGVADSICEYATQPAERRE